MSATVETVLGVARGWLGYSDANGKSKIIIDIYNADKPLPRSYPIKYTDAWCDVFVTAVAIEAKAVDIIGKECSPEKHVNIFKSKGIWIEDGKITPKPGDIIVFNWDRNAQPNDGYPDHIGYVESVDNGIITTIEGNVGRVCKRRTFRVGHGNIRGFARPKYAPSVPGTPPETPPAMTLDEIDALAYAVIRGEYGSGQARRDALGDKYDVVQARVNEILLGDKPKDINLELLAYRTIHGEFGSGEVRKQALGDRYAEVQAKVNEILRTDPKAHVDIEDLVGRTILGQFGHGEERKKNLGCFYRVVQNRVNEIMKGA